tara:strand:+ start:773 stop:982 length:210 start_codon:yes stop_codon:yes gene_type:complete
MYNEDIKAYIVRFFSKELQHDESIAGSMERKQLQKWLLAWALDEQHEEHIQQIVLDLKDKYTKNLTAAY